MEHKIEDMLAAMFTQWSGTKAVNVAMLPPSGSNRRYYRINSATNTAIGVYNPDHKENAAFLSFSRSLSQAGIRVPAIYASDEVYGLYLQQDLGDETLFSYLTRQRAEADGVFTDTLIDIYKKVLSQLVDIQVKGRETIDFAKCYPRQAFDKQSMIWDLQYFKYYFLKLAHITFDEQLLENDFAALMDYLLEVDHSYFLYRDFQSRNIMIINDEPWFIDYQGGRYGALQYDVASLLYDAKADIPSAVRTELLDYYVSQLGCTDRAWFIDHYYGYVFIRIMQAMGAYGYRGFFERKAHFLRSIPFAINNLRDLLENHPLPLDLPELHRVWHSVCESEELQAVGRSTRLTVTVTSFSYKHGIPTDNTGNGGGFVFDCRALPNPGRYDRYKQMTGCDNDVIEFFQQHEKEMTPFFDATKALVGQSVTRYMERGFTNLTVNFGCTGGQHRSVYCANAMAEWLRTHFDINVRLQHWEQQQIAPRTWTA